MNSLSFSLILQNTEFFFFFSKIDILFTLFIPSHLIYRTRSSGLKFKIEFPDWILINKNKLWEPFTSIYNTEIGTWHIYLILKFSCLNSPTSRYMVALLPEHWVHFLMGVEPIDTLKLNNSDWTWTYRLGLKPTVF